MHLFVQEGSLDLPNYLIKHQFDLQAKNKKIQNKKQIKINKRKLPLDFFRDSVQRSLSRRSPSNLNTKRQSKEKQIFGKRPPQTQRKIASHHYLPSSQFDQLHEFNLMKTDILKFNYQMKNILPRRLLHQQIERQKDQNAYQHSIKPKNRNLELKKNQDLDLQKINKTILRQNQKFKKHQELTAINQIECDKTENFKNQILQMNCTFGKGFKKSQSFSLQNTMRFHEQSLSSQKQIEEVIQRQKVNDQPNSSHKKYQQQKSTQQSEIMDALKSYQKSPLKENQRRRLFIHENQTSPLQNQKYSRQSNDIDNKIQWGSQNNNKDLYSIRDIHSKLGKYIFTAQQKQRTSKVRTLNSSVQYRQKSFRKQKRLEQLNLPRIDRILSIY